MEMKMEEVACIRQKPNVPSPPHCESSKTPHPCSRPPTQTGVLSSAALHCFGCLLSPPPFLLSPRFTAARLNLTSHPPRHSTSSPTPSWSNSSRKSTQRISYLVLTVHSFNLIPSYHQIPFYLEKHCHNSTRSLLPQSLRPSARLWRHRKSQTTHRKNISSNTPHFHSSCTIAVTEVYDQTREVRLVHPTQKHCFVLEPPPALLGHLLHFPHLPLNFILSGCADATTYMRRSCMLG